MLALTRLRVSVRPQTRLGKHAVQNRHGDDAPEGAYDDASSHLGTLPLLPICPLSSLQHGIVCVCVTVKL